MSRITRALVALVVALWVLPTAAAAGSSLPLVIQSGQTRQLPAGTALQTQASTTTSASLNTPPGVAPTTPVDGDRWLTTAGVFYRAGGVTYGPITLSSVTCGAPLTGGTITTTGTCGIATNGLALSYLAQIGGNSYLGNQSSTTGNVTAYTLPQCTLSDHAMHYDQSGAGWSCATVTGTSGGTNPFFIGTPDLRSGCGAPSASSDPVGSLYLDTCTADLYQQTQPNNVVPAAVQAASATGSSATLLAAPTAGDQLVAFCLGTQTLINGFTTITSQPSSGLSYKAISGYLPITTSGVSTNYTPCSGAAATYLIEISGVAVWGNSYVTTQAGYTYTPTYTTTEANDLIIGLFGGQRTSCGGAGTMTLTVLTDAQSTTTDGACTSFVGGAKQFATTGTNVAPVASGGPANATDQLIVLKPPTSGWKLVTPTWKNSGAVLTVWPLSINCSTGTLCAVDSDNNITLTATPATNSLALSTIAQQAANTVVGNFTGSTANVTANAMPSCSDASGNHLNYVAGTGITCGTSTSGPTISGTPTTGDCAKWASATALADAGAACGSGGGGSTGTVAYGNYNLIASQTLSASAANISFASLPQGYSDLIFVVSGRGDKAAANVSVWGTFNGDTAADYDYEDAQANNTSAFAFPSAAATHFMIGNVPAASATSGLGDTIVAEIANYAATSFQKAGVSQASLRTGTAAANLFRESFAFWWQSAAAITAVNFFPDTGNFVAGTTISIYGRGGNAPNITLSNGLVPIATCTPSGVSSCTFSSIPQTYTDLVLVGQARGDTAATSITPLIRFNGDTAANYNNEIGFLCCATTVAPTQTNGDTAINSSSVPAATANASQAGQIEITIPNYVGTTFFKQAFILNGEKVTTNNFADVGYGNWMNTAAITSLSITASAGNFVSGSTFTLYGRGGSQTVSVVPVGSGGTGQTNPAAHAVIVGEGSSNTVSVGPCSKGAFLMGQGSSADPICASTPLLTTLQLTAGQSISNGVWTTLSWATTPVEDDVGAFSAGSPTRITVPSGYTKVRFTYYGVWANNSTGGRYMELCKSGACSTEIDLRTALNESGNHMVTRWYTVAPGDYFEVEVNQTSGGSLTFSPSGGFGAPATLQAEWAP